MGKFICSCGHVISDVSVPCPYTGGLLGDIAEEESQKELDGIVSRLDKAPKEQRFSVACDTGYFTVNYPYSSSRYHELIDDLRFSIFGKRTHAVYECSECGRLWVQQTPGDNQYVSYKPDTDCYHAILRD